MAQPNNTNPRSNEIDASPPRADMRPTMREDDSKARAERRMEELRGHGVSFDEGTDKFFFDRAKIPDGWDYEFKRDTVYNQSDPAYQVQLARNGWQPVPLSRHPEEMPAGYAGNTILRDGQVLMERPAEMTKMARDHEQRMARRQVRAKEEQLTSANLPGVSFDTDNKGQAIGKGLRKGYSPMQISD